LLVHRALKRCPQQTGVDGPTQFTDAALALLCEGEYAGNVRELEGVVLCVFLFARDQGLAEIDAGNLPAELNALSVQAARGP